MNEILFKAIIATPWLLVLCVLDARERRLPNKWTLGGAAVALIDCFVVGGLSYFGQGLLAGILSALFLVLPFFLHAAGGGDVKMLFACGILIGLGNIVVFLFFISIAGFILAVVMMIAGKVDAGRLIHYLNCLFNFRYDRKAGREKLLPASHEKVQVPFGVAIACGAWMTWIWILSGGKMI